MRRQRPHRTVRNGGRQHVSCVSKELYDEPPESNFITIQLFYIILHKTLVILSRFNLGQILISILNYYMVKVQNTLDFCVPLDDSYKPEEIIERHEKTLPMRAQPIAWIFFIPALIFLRILRFWLSVCSIILGNGEVTAHHMKVKVSQFRRYYRSIRHFAVTEYWTEDVFKIIEARKKSSWWWRYYYRIYEKIFMMRPHVAHHCESAKENVINENGNGIEGAPNGHHHHHRQHKESLNVENEEDNNERNLDENLNANLVSNFEETLSVSSSSSMSDSDEGRTESQQKLNDDATGNDSHQRLSPDINQSNDYLKLQLSNLENEIMRKVLKHIEENQEKRENFNEIFYSPIGSPPEPAATRVYSSNSAFEN